MTRFLLALLLVPSMAWAQAKAPPGVAPNGNVSSYTVTPSGGTTARTLAARAGERLTAKDCGAKIDGTTDDTAAINSCIATLSASGGGVLLIPAGTSVISGITLKSNVWLSGSGERTTFLKCASAVCISNVQTDQLVGVRLTDLNIQPQSGYAGSTVISLSTLGSSEIARLLIEGFSTGTWLFLGGVVPTTIADSNLGGNVIFNAIRDITVYGCNVCMSLQGHYGSTTTASPPNSSNAPDQVLTQNKFDNINQFYVTGKGVDIVRAADTNVWTGGLINLIANGAVGVVNGDDGSYTGNTYVNSNKFLGLAFSKASSITTVTFFSSQNYTFAIEGIGLETDIDTSVSTITPVSMSNAQSYRICGKRMDASAFTGLGCLEKGIAWKQSIVVSPSNSFVYQAPTGFDKVVLSGSGTLAGGGITLTCSPPDNLRLVFATTALTVTSLTAGSCPSAGQSIYGWPGTISPTTPFAMRYILNSNVWVRD